MTSELAPAPVSLTGLARVLALALILALLAMAAFAFRSDISALFGHASGQGGDSARIARRLIVYRLDPARPTVFRFTQPVRLTRILTSPVVDRHTAVRGQEWVYGLRAQLLAGDGRIIATHDVYSRSGLIGANGERIGSVRFFRGSADQVGSADEMRIASPEPVAAVALYAGLSQPRVRAIDVRVYERRFVSPGAAITGFSRLSPDDRARLARANAFPSDMLSAQERANIAINQWKPIGPAGIEGRDYRMLVQYESETPDPEDAPGNGETGE
jgi:hypothetical protein